MRHQPSTTRRLNGLFLLPALFLIATAAWVLAPGGDGSYSLDYHVGLVPEGIEVRVEVRGGPGDAAWIGFGVGPGAPAGILTRIRHVQARLPSGAALEVTPWGTAGYRVAVGSAREWELTYRLHLDEPAGTTFYRSSGRWPRHLMLLGSDAWARFYVERSPLASAPEGRPAGSLATATVTFDAARLPEDWTVVTTCPRVGPMRYWIADDLVTSIFALGAYDVSSTPTGLTVATHADWTMEREALAGMSSRLFQVMVDELGPPLVDGPLALFSPLPGNLRPETGIATAGMARARTLTMFAGAVPGNGLVEDPKSRETLALLVAHELFHLYVPWGVPMTAELSWFSEGWAMHAARKAATKTGMLSPTASEARLREIYREYARLVGHSADAPPQASKPLDRESRFLYLRGELVLRYLDRRWQAQGRRASFDAALWSEVKRRYDGTSPLTLGDLRAVLAGMVGGADLDGPMGGSEPLSEEELGF